jgi:hypothetical protein
MHTEFFVREPFGNLLVGRPRPRPNNGILMAGWVNGRINLTSPGLYPMTDFVITGVETSGCGTK